MLALVKILASLGSGRLKPMPLDFEDAVIFAGALGAFTIHIQIICLIYIWTLNDKSVDQFTG